MDTHMVNDMCAHTSGGNLQLKNVVIMGALELLCEDWGRKLKG
jgi:hypothetical protein